MLIVDSCAFALELPGKKTYVSLYLRTKSLMSLSEYVDTFCMNPEESSPDFVARMMVLTNQRVSGACWANPSLRD